MTMLENKSNEAEKDKELILLLQNGHDPALNEIMSRYKERLFSFIYNYIKDPDISKEILQEVFVKLYFKAKTYNPNYGFSTWIHKIAINLCYDYNKKQKLRRLFSLDSDVVGASNLSYHETIEDENSNLENLVESRQELFILEKEMEKLPHKLKTSLILFVLEGNSQEECAKILKITPKALEARVYRARKILARKMAIKF